MRSSPRMANPPRIVRSTGEPGRGVIRFRGQSRRRGLPGDWQAALRGPGSLHHVCGDPLAGGTLLEPEDAHPGSRHDRHGGFKETLQLFPAPDDSGVTHRPGVLISLRAPGMTSLNAAEIGTVSVLTESMAAGALDVEQVIPVVGMNRGGGKKCQGRQPAGRGSIHWHMRLPGAGGCQNSQVSWILAFAGMMDKARSKIPGRHACKRGSPAHPVPPPTLVKRHPEFLRSLSSWANKVISTLDFIAGSRREDPYPSWLQT